MLKIAVCDDDSVIIGQIQNYLSAELGGLKIPYLAECCSSGEQLILRLCEGNSYDLIYLDISMDGISGIEVGKVLREQLHDTKTLLIFISSFEEKARELFECNTFRFLVKPFDRDRFAEYLKSALEYLEMREEACLDFKEIKGGQVSLSARNIIYMESAGRVIRLVTENREYRFYGKLGYIAERMQKEDFIRIHNSILVNFDHISAIRYDSVILSNGEIKDISGPRRKAAREDYADIRDRRGL